MVIEIRLQRLAGNQKTAADKLVDLIEFESKWNDKLNYSAGQSQQKELDYARKYLVSRANNALDQNKALEAQAILVEYDPIFKASKAKDDQILLKNRISQVARKVCFKMKKEIKKDNYFFRSYVFKYCSYFDVEANLAKATSYHSFSNVLITLNTKNASDRDKYQTILKDEFKRSFLYTPEAKTKLKLDANFKFNSKHIKSAESLKYRYRVEVPYTYFEKKKEWKSTPYTTTEKVKVGCKKTVKGNCLEPVMAEKSVTKYKSVPKYVVIKDTKFRDEYQTLRYPATKHSISASGASTIKSNTESFSDSYAFSNTFIEHYTSFPKAKISPKAYKGDGIASFKEKIMLDAAKSFFNEYRTSWKKKYCHTNSSKASNIEQVFMCLASNPTDKSANSWFLGRFGISYLAATKYLDKSLLLVPHK